MITVSTVDGARDGYSFISEGVLHEVELGTWHSVLIEWWLSARDWAWGEA